MLLKGGGNVQQVSIRTVPLLAVGVLPDREST